MSTDKPSFVCKKKAKYHYTNTHQMHSILTILKMTVSQQRMPFKTGDIVSMEKGNLGASRDRDNLLQVLNIIIGKLRSKEVVSLFIDPFI